MENASLTAGCEIFGTLRDSVLGANVTIEQGAVVENSVLMSGCTVKAGAVVRYAILDENAVIGENARVGEENAGPSGITVIGCGVCIAAGQTAAAGEMRARN